MSFGAHTVSHPLLSQLSDSESRNEIRGAWERLGTQARRPIPIFCYPNGRICDFGSREIDVLRELGLRGALTAESGYATVRAFGRNEDAAFQVPRLPFPDQLDRLIFMVSGGERVAEMFRRR
jgi:peptidoglycan/xylan/chitin deacetylase (PgdA/CDA1 family)